MVLLKRDIFRWLGLAMMSISFYAASAQDILNINFERISTADGLSNNQIYDIFQDRQGFIWIGTLSGLNRYDGYEIKTFYHKEGDKSSLKDNTILWMANGPEKKIWVKHVEGFSIYDPYLEQFGTPEKYLELLQTDAAFITGVEEDKNGDFWFAINNRGLVKLKGDLNLLQFNNSSDADVKIASNEVDDMFLDRSGNLWIVHASGSVEVIDPNNNKVIKRYGLPESLAKGVRYWHIFVDEDLDLWLYGADDSFGVYYLNTQTGISKILNEKTLKSELIRGIIQKENGDLWIGADHGGISVLNKHTWNVSTILNDPDLPKSLVNNNIKTVFQDRNGGIWVGTTKSGVSYHHRGANNFDHYKVNKKDPAYNDMSSFVEDEYGNLWIGTNGKSLLYFDRSERAFSSILEDPDIQGSIPDVVVSLLYTSNQELWVGTYLEGLFRFDGRRFEKVDILQEPNSSGSSVWELFEDSRGNIWIGTLSKGVFKYNPESEEIVNYTQPNPLNSNYVTSITEDHQNRIWLGTGLGVSVYHPEGDSIKTYVSAGDSEKGGLSSGSIFSVFNDTSGRTWIGTLDGLNLYNEDTDDFTVLREDDGLSSNIIMSIQEDNSGNLWLSTSRGVTKLAINNDQYDFQTFDLSDGLQGQNFTEDAGLKTSDGYLIFSGQNGFNIFNPEDIIINDHTSNLLFTGLFLSNNRVTPGTEFEGDVVLEKPMNEIEDLYLDYEQNSVAFEFVVLSFFQSGKIRYQYKLEGLDAQWINASPEMRRAAYNNLSPGDYVFKVRSSNNPNSWTEGNISLNIHIRPPFWQTAWAYVGYFILIIAALYLTRRSIVRKERKKASLENERREAERQHQMDLMKIKFFTNISHEFRTPLSLVLTPIERMLKNPENVKMGDLTIIQRNAKRLMTLVNQLLDFRKMEANQHVLNRSNGDLISFMQDIVDSFSDLSREKEVELSFETEVKGYYTVFDKDKMEKIMFNLLSNAFKFTLPGGDIVVDVEILNRSNNKRSVAIMVSDTGIGIPEEKQQLIFNRFFQSEITDNIINNGTGIGLSITKEFVELHGGTISVESQPNMGSTFTVEMPLEEIKGKDQAVDELVKELELSVKQNENEEVLPKSEDRHTVLLVEDNFDFRFYLKDNLKQLYNVTTASNGREAWKLIRNDLPDIIISDVMMPMMDGHELCEKVKSDPRTSHIPVILLTAQSSDQHRIQGLEAGAIEYISKPFNFEILISSINSALKFQRRVQEANELIKVKPSEIDVESMDEKLISKATELVENNMSNSEFSVEDLSHELGYSRGHFYQKLLKITGESPIDFIRNIRMKRAADLLAKSQLNVSEIAYKVGYNNPKLFSRYFKSQYKSYPSQYRSNLARVDKQEDSK